MDDDRHVRVEFFETGTGVTVRQTFDAESATPVDEQRLDWQSVLDRFTRHVAAIHRQRLHSERNMSEIAEVERSRLRALVDGDIDLARTFHHPEFQLVTPRGVALSLDEYLAEIAFGSIRYLRWDPEAIIVRRSRDTAVIRYRAEIEMMSDGLVLPLFRTWHTDTYERHMAHWKAVWSHATMIV